MKHSINDPYKRAIPDEVIYQEYNKYYSNDGNETQQEIADRLGVKKATIVKYFKLIRKNNGVLPNFSERRATVISEEDVKEAVQRRLAGGRRNRGTLLADSYGVKYNTLYKRMKPIMKDKFVYGYSANDAAEREREKQLEIIAESGGKNSKVYKRIQNAPKSSFYGIHQRQSSVSVKFSLDAGKSKSGGYHTIEVADSNDLNDYDDNNAMITLPYYIFSVTSIATTLANTIDIVKRAIADNVECGDTIEDED